MIGPGTRKVKDEGRRADGQMGRWADGQMGRWADGQMGGWADGQQLIHRQTTNRAIESPSQPPRLIACLLELSPFFYFDELEISDELKNISKLGKRPHGNVEIAPEFAWTLLGRAFGDVCRHRKRRPSCLRCQTIELFAGETPRYSIREQHQLVSGAPSLETFIS